MNFNGEYEKKVLTALHESASREISNYDLAAICAVDLNGADDNKIDRFISCVRFLHDEGYLECPKAADLGFSRIVNTGERLQYRALYRLTSSGNDFVEAQTKPQLLSRFSSWLWNMFKEAIHKPLVWLILIGLVLLIAWVLNHVFGIQLPVDNLLKLLTKREGLQ